METLPLVEAVTRFLHDLRRAERSAHTLRAYRTELQHLTANPLIKLERVKVPEPAPRGVPREQIDAVLNAIPFR